ncbi:hypothetical protein GF352_04370, partial [archaeon]|nr:hypothetical protein [archaeon]
MVNVNELIQVLVGHKKLKDFGKGSFDTLIKKVDWGEVEKKYEEAFKHFHKALKAAQKIEHKLDRMYDFAKRTGKETKDIDYASSIIKFYLYGYTAQIEHGDWFHGLRTTLTNMGNLTRGRKEGKYKYALSKELASYVLKPETSFSDRHLKDFVGGLAKSGYIETLSPGYGTSERKRIIKDKINKIKLKSEVFKDFKSILRLLREQKAFCMVGRSQWLDLLNTLSLKVKYDTLPYDKSSPAVIMNSFWKKLINKNTDLLISIGDGVWFIDTDVDYSSNKVNKMSLPGVETPFLHLQRDDGDVYSRFFFPTVEFLKLEKEHIKEKIELNPPFISIISKKGTPLANYIINNDKSKKVRKSTNKKIRLGAANTN